MGGGGGGGGWGQNISHFFGFCQFREKKDPNRSWTRGSTWAKPLKLKDKVKMRGGAGGWGQNISHFFGFYHGEKERAQVVLSVIHEVPSIRIRRAKN